MDHVSELVRKHFDVLDGELSIDGLSAGAISLRYGTPLFVYSQSALDKKYALLRDALPPQFSIFYSVKANPNSAIIRHFLPKGCGFEIASAGEFYQALSAGGRPENIIFAGPGKSVAELEAVLRKNIGEIHVESSLEAERIEKLCQELGVRAQVALRINPQGEAEGGAMRMGGRPAPFGVDEETMDDVLAALLALPHLNFRGIHLFAGTQILDFSILLTQYRKGLDIARRAAIRSGRPLHTVDFGGGLGIPYFSHEQELDVIQLRSGLRDMMAEIADDPLFANTNFVVEPGRYLVGDSGIYITRVSDIKVSRGKKFVIVDGGMHHHLAASGNLGQTIKRNYPVAVLNKMDLPAEETVEVVGPLCTPLDVLARNVNLPRVAVGDLIGVFQSGAYARAASPLNFLSHATPPEVLVEDGQGRLIRHRGSYEDYLRDVAPVEEKHADKKISVPR